MKRFRIFVLSAVPVTIRGLKNSLESERFHLYFSSDISDKLLEKFFSSFQNNSLNISKEFYPDIIIIDDYGFPLTFNEKEFLKFINKMQRCKEYLNIDEIRKIIVYTGCHDAIYLKSLADQGVRGLVHKTSQTKTILDAVDIVSKGGLFFDEVSSRLMFNYQIIMNEYQQLSKREKEILKLIVLKTKNKEIADQFFISVKTVENHKENIKNKLKLKSIKDISALSILAN